MSEWTFWVTMLIATPIVAVIAMCLYAVGAIGLAVYYETKGKR